MATPSRLLFTFRLIPVINGILARHGIDGADLLERAGLPLEAMRGEITAPLSRIRAFVDDAAKRTNNDLFGLDLAEAVPTGAYGVAEFLSRSAPTLQAGLQMVSEFSVLVNPTNSFHFIMSASEGRLHYAVASQRDALGMHLNEYSIAYIMRQFSTALGSRLPVTRAWFAHARTARAEAVAKRLECEVQFSAPDCGFALAEGVLARVPKTADPPLFAFLEGQARAQLARIGSIDIVTQVVRVIEARIPHADVSANAIARVMATTVRSLQRHLAGAGTNYRDVLAHVRNRRRGELRSGGVAESEIARQLGFADARSMRRSLGE